MEDPYKVETTDLYRKETIRELWQKPIECPHCRGPGFKVGPVAFALKSRFKCSRCGERSHIRLSPAGSQRFWRRELTTLACALAVFGAFWVVNEEIVLAVNGFVAGRGTKWQWLSFAERRLIVIVGGLLFCSALVCFLIVFAVTSVRFLLNIVSCEIVVTAISGSPGAS